MKYNIYCDESCHLEHDNSNAMTLGAIWCPNAKVREINNRIRAIKARNKISPTTELKWTKISPAKLDAYMDIINYFFDDDDLHFRCLVVPDKSKLNHKQYNQTHDDWYYKMYFDMLKTILSPQDQFEIYIDIKDTNSYRKSQLLKSVCCNSMYDFSQHIIKTVQPIRSEEVAIMQLVDILTGAVVYENRHFPKDHTASSSKKAIIDCIKARSGYALKKTTLYKEDKCNIFIWRASSNE